MVSFVKVLRVMRCEEGGMPVMGSILVFSWAMDHEGVMRRSEEEYSDVTYIGTSDMLTGSFA